MIYKRCKHCKQLKNKHETWSATGEYAENAVCPTKDIDEQGRYRKLCFFEPMNNLDYIEYKAKKRNLI